MEFTVATLVMFLLSFPIFGCKAQEGAAGLSNFAPSWMTSFQRGPETAGTLFGLPSPSPPTPTGPEVLPNLTPSQPADPQPHPADPQPSTLPHPADPQPSDPDASEPSTTPAAVQPLSLPRSLGPPVPRATSPDIIAPQDCERAYCHHHKSDNPNEPIHGPLTQQMQV